MTRDDYRQLVIKENKDVNSDYVMRPVNFVHVLQDVAINSFLYPDKYSDTLKNETRRRLVQLHETGVTDL